MVCGPENPDGWGLEMTVGQDTRVRGTITFGARHEGAPGVAHGGALAAALGDTFGSVLLALRTPAVTANLNVNYRARIPLHRELICEAWCDRVEGRKLFMSGRALDGDTVLADATALFIEVPVEQFHPEGVAEWWRPMPGSASDG
jgi:acyl-coenzyme A thioesterase PaaI-like protein